MHLGNPILHIPLASVTKHGAALQKASGFKNVKRGIQHGFG